MAERMHHPTPMLDELENRPLPSVFPGIKRLRDKHPEPRVRAVNNDLLGQLEHADETPRGCWQRGTISGYVLDHSRLAIWVAGHYSNARSKLGLEKRFAAGVSNNPRRSAEVSAIVKRFPKAYQQATTDLERRARNSSRLTTESSFRAMHRPPEL